MSIGDNRSIQQLKQKRTRNSQLNDKPNLTLNYNWCSCRCIFRNERKQKMKENRASLKKWRFVERIFYFLIANDGRIDWYILCIECVIGFDETLIKYAPRTRVCFARFIRFEMMMIMRRVCAGESTACWLKYNSHLFYVFFVIFIHYVSPSFMTNEIKRQFFRSLCWNKLDAHFNSPQIRSLASTEVQTKTEKKHQFIIDWKERLPRTNRLQTQVEIQSNSDYCLLV